MRKITSLNTSNTIQSKNYYNTLKNHMITNLDSNFNGAYGWNAADDDSTVEVKSTGEIWMSEFLDNLLEESNIIDDNIHFFKNSKFIVTDPTDEIYKDYPNPPIGGVFNNAKRSLNKITRGYIDVPPCVNSILVLTKIYKKTSDSILLDRAKLIADYLISTISECNYYGRSIYLVAPRNRYSSSKQKWEISTSEFNIRNTYQVILALLKLYEVSTDQKYLDNATKLLKTCGTAYNNICDRVNEGSLNSYMHGAIYEYVYQENGATTWSWSVVSSLSVDAMAEALYLYIELVGDVEITDYKDGIFKPSKIIHDFKEHVKNSIKAGVYEMSNGTGLPYYFMRDQVGTNWDWVGNEGYGDTWFANDAVLWVIKGLSLIASKEKDEELIDIVSRYREIFYRLHIKNDKGELLWYDRYTFDGNTLPDDHSLSISATSLMYDIDVCLYSLNREIDSSSLIKLKQLKEGNSLQKKVIDNSIEINNVNGSIASIKTRLSNILGTNNKNNNRK